MLAMLVARIVLGAVWIVAGLIKVRDPAASVRAVRVSGSFPVGRPGRGLRTALSRSRSERAWSWGSAVRIDAIVSAVLLGAFIVGVTSAWARGLSIDCGCFGGGGAVASDQTRYGTEVLRDGAILVVAAILIRWPASRFALVLPKAAP